MAWLVSYHQAVRERPSVKHFFRWPFGHRAIIRRLKNKSSSLASPPPSYIDQSYCFIFSQYPGVHLITVCYLNINQNLRIYQSDRCIFVINFLESLLDQSYGCIFSRDTMFLLMGHDVASGYPVLISSGAICLTPGVQKFFKR